ncbi:hypothetical protein CLOM_g19504 [Closterium sp. NIES-68]|nr:hypothetical protein CLOM_g19504 [Closterium sp. NIES-68]GJP80785.1 hypothetical protein CLOP_g10986 [Closterium sp. NIES-67]
MYSTTSAGTITSNTTEEGDGGAVTTTHPGAFDSFPDDLLISVFRRLVPESPPLLRLCPVVPPSSSLLSPPDVSPLSLSPSPSSSSSHAFVCKRWLQLAYLAHTSIHVTQHTREISASQLIRAVNRMPSLNSLQIDFLGNDPVTDALITEIANACPRLELLSLSSSRLRHAWTTQGLETLFRVCTRLKQLSLHCPPAVKTFPAAVSNLTGLVRLNICLGKFVSRLPEELGALGALESFCLEAPLVASLPSSLGDLTNLRELELVSCRALSSVPETIGKLLKLSAFHAMHCDSLRSLPDALCQCSSLDTLHLSLFNLAGLPENIGQLPSLRCLVLHSSYGLHALPTSFTQLPSLRNLRLTVRARRLPDDLGNLTSLQSLELSDCSELTHLPSSLPQLSLLESLAISRCGQLFHLPEDMGQLSALQELDLSHLKNLQDLPNEIGQLQRLYSLRLHCCDSLSELPESFSQLTALKTLTINCCDLLSSLPQGIDNLTCLQELTLSECPSINQLPASISRCLSLHRISIRNCSRLTNVPEEIRHLVG